MTSIIIFSTAFHKGGEPIAQRHLTYDVEPRYGVGDLLDIIYASANGATMKYVTLGRKDPKATSASVGDVITLRKGEEIKHYIIAPVGFKELPAEVFSALMFQFTKDDQIDPRGFWGRIARLPFHAVV